LRLIALIERCAFDRPHGIYVENQGLFGLKEREMKTSNLSTMVFAVWMTALGLSLAIDVHADEAKKVSAICKSQVFGRSRLEFTFKNPYNSSEDWHDWIDLSKGEADYCKDSADRVAKGEVTKFCGCNDKLEWFASLPALAWIKTYALQCAEIKDGQVTVSKRGEFLATNFDSSNEDAKSSCLREKNIALGQGDSIKDQVQRGVASLVQGRGAPLVESIRAVSGRASPSSVSSQWLGSKSSDTQGANAAGGLR
jgi:hypothetical protein